MKLHTPLTPAESRAARPAPTPKTDAALQSPDDGIVARTSGNGVHQSVARALEREADANADLLRRLVPLLEAAASGAQVAMAAGDLLRDVQARLVAWEGFQP